MVRFIGRRGGRELRDKIAMENTSTVQALGGGQQ